MSPNVKQKKNEGENVTNFGCSRSAKVLKMHQVRHSSSSGDHYVKLVLMSEDAVHGHLARWGAEAGESKKWVMP